MELINVGLSSSVTDFSMNAFDPFEGLDVNRMAQPAWQQQPIVVNLIMVSGIIAVRSRVEMHEASFQELKLLGYS